jgi:hypothetical protein
MITTERLAFLRFQAEHKGIAPHQMDRMIKAGASLPEHSAMIAITPSELQDLLATYPKETPSDQGS